MRGLLELRELFEGGSNKRKYGKYLPTSDALDEEDVCFLSAVGLTGEEDILIPILNFENNFSNIFEFSRSAQVLTVQWYLIN